MIPETICAGVWRHLEKRAFKRRIVFAVDRTDYVLRATTHPIYRIVHYEYAHPEFQSKPLRTVADCVGVRRFERRSMHPGIALFVAMEHKDKVAGFYWAVRSSSKPLWHDKLKVEPHTALLFNAHVFPEYRRQGLYSLLLAAAHNVLFQSFGVERALTIVECSNQASLQANRKFGLRVFANNYLIKLAGRNIISILEGPEGYRWDYVFRNEKGNNL